MKTLLVVGVLLLILYNLGAALYFLLVDHGATNRTASAFMRRIGLSVLLILLVTAGLSSGVIPNHGVPV